MTLRVEEGTLKNYTAYLDQLERGLAPPHIFALPPWLNAWWSVFGNDKRSLVYSIWDDSRLIGLAPLMEENGKVYLIGSPDLCDYLDFVILSGMESSFFSALLPRLRADGFQEMVLHAQRPEAAVFEGLFGAEGRGETATVSFLRENCSYELNLPDSWDRYLAGLNKKQRHEVRRKLRRFKEQALSPQWAVYSDQQEIRANFPRFLELFLKNPEKADFYSDQVDRFFHALVTETSGAGLCRLGFLESDGILAAAVLYFDYGGRIYLYNSGYDSDLRHLSVGLVSKVHTIEMAIEGKQSIFDFLKGREVYKHRLGGRAVPVYKVAIKL